VSTATLSNLQIHSDSVVSWLVADGECDEPNLCPEGTDVADCAGSRTDCPYTDDGECDDGTGSTPQYCPRGSDVADCAGSGSQASHGGSGSCSTITPNGGNFPGNIQSSGDTETWCLNAQGGTTYLISVELAGLSDSVLEVYDPSGSNKLAEDDDGGVGTASYLEWTAPGSGMYRLVVKGYGSRTGTYQISVSSSAADDPCQVSLPKHIKITHVQCTHAFPIESN
jgi:hypothetical protein